MGHHHEIAVRYGEVDMQRVVFNAHYLAYVDDAMDHWLAHALGRPDVSGFTAATDFGFDYMVRRVVVEWSSPARHGDLLRLDAEVTRWGNSSFDVKITGNVDGREIFASVLTGVCVTPGTATPGP